MEPKKVTTMQQDGSHSQHQGVHSSNGVITLGINDVGVNVNVMASIESSLTVEESSKEGIVVGKAAQVKVGVGKRGMPPEELAKLAIANPRKAKRIIANRRAAAKSKERKKLYEKELEERVNMLQVHADIFFANLARCKRDTEARAVENLELRMQMEALGQHLQQRCALRDAMKEELNYYRYMNNQFAIEMANDPCHSELQSEFSSMLASRRRSQCSNLQPLEAEISLPPFPPSLPFGMDFNEHSGPNYF